MNFAQMSTFQAVMTSASLSDAAHKLGRTQPAVSAAIKALEDQLGLQLFERRGRKLIPVPEAASSDVIQAAARQAQELYQQLKQGADFGQLAISRSAGDNALEGGEIGWRKAAQLPQPFDSMIGSLAVGDVTEPVRTPGGFIILKLVDVLVGLRVDEEEETQGLDLVLHDERGYDL